MVFVTLRIAPMTTLATLGTLAFVDRLAADLTRGFWLVQGQVVPLGTPAEGMAGAHSGPPTNTTSPLSLSTSKTLEV